MENEEIEELDFYEWWEMLDDIEREEYSRCMKELEESEIKWWLKRKGVPENECRSKWEIFRNTKRNI